MKNFKAFLVVLTALLLVAPVNASEDTSEYQQSTSEWADPHSTPDSDFDSQDGRTVQRIKKAKSKRISYKAAKALCLQKDESLSQKSKKKALKKCIRKTQKMS